MRTALHSGDKAEKQMIDKEEKRPSVSVNAGEKDRGRQEKLHMWCSSIFCSLRERGAQ